GGENFRCGGADREPEGHPLWLFFGEQRVFVKALHQHAIVAAPDRRIIIQVGAGDDLGRQSAHSEVTYASTLLLVHIARIPAVIERFVPVLESLEDRK